MPGILWFFKAVVLLFAATISTMHWLTSSRLAPCRDGDPELVCYPRSTLIAATTMSLLLLPFIVAGLFVWPIVPPMPLFQIGYWLSLSLFSWILLIHIRWIVEYFRVEYRLYTWGMSYRTLLTSPGKVLWADVASVRYSLWRRWFTIRTTTGVVVHLPTMLGGLSQFGLMALRQIPSSKMDSETTRSLRLVADGLSLPTIWTL